jgi:hypothetical protein
MLSCCPQPTTLDFFTHHCSKDRKSVQCEFGVVQDLRRVRDPEGKAKAQGGEGEERERERESVCVWMWAGECVQVHECEMEAAEVSGRWHLEQEMRMGDKSKINRKKRHTDRNGVRPWLSDLDKARCGGLYIWGR